MSFPSIHYYFKYYDHALDPRPELDKVRHDFIPIIINSIRSFIFHVYYEGDSQ